MSSIVRDVAAEMSEMGDQPGLSDSVMREAKLTVHCDCRWGGTKVLKDGDLPIALVRDLAEPTEWFLGRPNPVFLLRQRVA